MEGNWVDNKLGGQVQIYHKNGDIHEGNWEGQRLVGQGKVTEKESGKTYDGEFLYDEEQATNGKVIVNFVYTNGPNVGEKYKFDSWGEENFNLEDTNVDNEVLISGMRMNVNTLAKQMTEERPEFKRLSSMSDPKNITRGQTDKENIFKELLESDENKENLLGKIKAKLKELLMCDIQKITLMLALKKKILGKMKMFSTASPEEQIEIEAELEADLTEEKKQEILKMTS